jgi:hypothetical protein
MKFSLLFFLILGILIVSWTSGQTIGSSQTFTIPSNIIPSGFSPHSVWDGIGSSWDGQIYQCVTDHQEVYGDGRGESAVFHFNPYTRVWRSLGTNKAASQRANNWMPNESQAKIHSPVVQVANGEMWMASHDNSDDDITRWHRGSHWYAINLQGRLVDKSAEQDSAPMLSREQCIFWHQNHQVYNPKFIPTDSTGIAIHYESIIGIGYNPQVPDVIYGSTYPRALIVRHDISRKVSRVVGMGNDIFPKGADMFNGVTRAMVVDRCGNAYCPGKATFVGDQITKYDYANDTSYAYQTGQGASAWAASTHSWSGDSIFVIYHNGKIYGHYENSTEFEYIASVDRYCPNLVISRDCRTLYAVPARQSRVYKINIATGGVTTFGSVPSSAGYTYGHNCTDTNGYAYYSYGGPTWNKIFRVYLGKNELGPYKKHPVVNVKDETALKDNDKLRLSCFPNPFRTSVFFEIRTAKSELRDMQAAIYDVTGKLVWSHVARRTSHVWDASGQPGGVYLVRVNTGKRILQEKVTLIR